MISGLWGPMWWGTLEPPPPPLPPSPQACQWPGKGPGTAAKEVGGGFQEMGFRCPPPPPPNGCIGREGASEAAPEAVRQAVGGGCQSGWGRLL